MRCHDQPATSAPAATAPHDRPGTDALRVSGLRQLKDGARAPEQTAAKGAKQVELAAYQITHTRRTRTCTYCSRRRSSRWQRQVPEPPALKPSRDDNSACAVLLYEAPLMNSFTCDMKWLHRRRGLPTLCPARSGYEVPDTNSCTSDLMEGFHVAGYFGS